MLISVRIVDCLNAISPDGSTIAMVATSGEVPKLWVRRLESLAPRELAGTEGAQYPFWSPDSRSLGFFASAKLKRIELSGGPVTTLANAQSNRGGAWGQDGTIIFAPSVLGGLKRIPAASGPVVPFRADPNWRPPTPEQSEAIKQHFKAYFASKAGGTP